MCLMGSWLRHHDRTHRGGIVTSCTTVVVVVLVLLWCDGACGHGRLIEPPSRSSMWRFGYDTEPNYQDNQLYCGGFTNQWQQQGGRCGVCGDPWQGPRDNEPGGKYARGIIVRRYRPGSVIRLVVDLTAPHKGWFEFRLCPNNNPLRPVTHECLDRYLLEQSDGTGTRYPVTSTAGEYQVVDVRLPAGLQCSQCVLQWKYHAGNSWGTDEDGRSCVGCGPQEEFYGCADVAIGGSKQYDDEYYIMAMYTTKSPTTTTTTTTTTAATTTTRLSTPIQQQPLPDAAMNPHSPQYHNVMHGDTKRTPPHSSDVGSPHRGHVSLSHDHRSHAHHDNHGINAPHQSHNHATDQRHADGLHPNLIVTHHPYTATTQPQPQQNLHHRRRNLRLRFRQADDQPAGDQWVAYDPDASEESEGAEQLDETSSGASQQHVDHVDDYADDTLVVFGSEWKTDTDSSPSDHHATNSDGGDVYVGGSVYDYWATGTATVSESRAKQQEQMVNDTLYLAEELAGVYNYQYIFDDPGTGREEDSDDVINSRNRDEEHEELTEDEIQSIMSLILSSSGCLSRLSFVMLTCVGIAAYEILS